MTDDEFLFQEMRIDELVAKWVIPLGLDRWERVVFHCHRGVLVDYPEAAGTCTVDWKYLQMVVSFNAEMLVDMDNSHLEHVFLHECVHALINEIAPPVEQSDHEERVVTELAQTLQRVWEAGK